MVCEVFGLSPNLEKTQAMWIWEPYGDAEIFESSTDIQWYKKLEILGVTFDNGLSSITEIYSDKLSEIKREIARWKLRNISLIGKVTIAKSLLI